MFQDICLEGGELVVTVEPDFGGSVGTVTSRSSGRQILFRSPWGGRPPGPVQLEEGPASWLERYRGGWHTIAPNGGTGCEVDGARHGFHGEASTAPWTVTDVSTDSVSMRLDLFSLPLRFERRISTADATVTVEESIENLGVEPTRFMWGHHPAFGDAILDGSFRLDIDAQVVLADVAFGEEEVGVWPFVTDLGGQTYDLSKPEEGSSMLAYILDVPAGRATLARDDGSLSATLRWDPAVFPHMWIWIELGGTRGWPWYGRCRTIGIEPVTSWPGRGLAEVIARGNPLMTLGPGESIATAVELTVDDNPGTRSV